MDTGLEFRVTGHVQGVGFRYFVQKTGVALGLTGWVKNNPDGSVRGLAEGDQGMLVEFSKQVRIGNSWSNVEGMDQNHKEYTGSFKNFEIRY